MEFILNVLTGSIGQVWVTLQHNWLYLAASVVSIVACTVALNCVLLFWFWWLQG